MTQIGRISFAPLTHSTLGFDRFFQDVERLLEMDASKTISNFPPHNILKLADNLYVVEMAIAGFSKDEIQITVEDGELIIQGEKKKRKLVHIYTKVLVPVLLLKHFTLLKLLKFVEQNLKMVF